VIDLGSHPERAYEADDVRSNRNFNTGIPGTLQKYASQSGVFRLAMKHLPVADPTLFNEMLSKGYVVESPCPTRYHVPTTPRDMRKPLLELLMKAVEDRSSPPVDRIFRELGEFMAVAWLETEWLLDPKAKGRVLFGGVLTHPACASLVIDGATKRVPHLSLIVADQGLANTPLMRELKGHSGYSVAQYGQAIGAIHYANHRLCQRGRPGAVET
jgi:hypothetical protein